MTNPLFDRLFAPHGAAETPFLRLSSGAAISHQAYLAQTARLAHALVGLGLTPGDRLAAQISKSPAALALYGACVRAGVVFLPLNTAYTPEEVSYFVEDSAAAVLVVDPGAAETLRLTAERLGAALETLSGKEEGASGEGSLDKAAAAAPDRFEPAARAADDLAALLYTSGTTGRSKGAMMSHDNLLSNAVTLADAWRFSADDALLHALPIFHTHGLFVATNVTLAAGGSMIFLPKFDIDAMIAGLSRATAMMGVPTFYTRLLADPRLTREHVAGMRLFISGSAPLLAETHIAFEERTGHRILERYGMTETNMITTNPYYGDRRAGTVGAPLKGVEVRLTDPETGADTPPGEIGQVEVRGPNVFQGYWRMPEKTKAELRENGFFITGDLGRFDEDGYLQIVGRDKDLIISGGFNIYPKELEQILDQTPGVLESAVIGAPHADFGESVVAVLARAPGAEPDLGAAEAAMTALAKFKRPRAYRVVGALPRNAMGKVQKNVLRETYRAAFADE